MDLQVRGNIYLVSLALGNLLVTALVLPASCVAILASIPHDQGICCLQWHATIVCFLVSVLSFMFMAVENFLGLGSLVTYDLCCTKFRLVTAVLAIWAVAVSFSAGQYALGWGPSFCKHNLKIWFPYHVAAGSVLICLPALITVLFFTRSVFKLKSFKVQVESLEDPTAYVLTDEFLLKSNIVVFVVLLLMWTPCAVVATISLVRPVAQDLVDTSWWLALSNSCVYSYVYAATNKDFREAFNKLFHYCCCKSHVTFSRRQRESRRFSEGRIGLRVHIIPGLNIYAQRKENTTSSGGRGPSGQSKGVCDL